MTKPAIVNTIHTFSCRCKIVTHNFRGGGEGVRSHQSLSVIMNQSKQVSLRLDLKTQWGTIKHCPRNWVLDSRCRVTEASRCEVSSPGRLWQQWSTRWAESSMHSRMSVCYGWGRLVLRYSRPWMSAQPSCRFPARLVASAVCKALDRLGAWSTIRAALFCTCCNRTLQ